MPLEQMRFVRSNVVTKETDSAAQRGRKELQDRAVCHPEKRMPPVEDNKAGAQAVQRSRGSNPGHRIDRIDERIVGFHDRICALIVLRLSGEKDAGILPAKSNEFDAIALAQIPDEERRIMRNAAPKWERHPHDDQRSACRRSSRRNFKVIRKPDGKRNDRECRIGVADGRKNRAPRDDTDCRHRGLASCG